MKCNQVPAGICVDRQPVDTEQTLRPCEKALRAADWSVWTSDCSQVLAGACIVTQPAETNRQLQALLQEVRQYVKRTKGIQHAGLQSSPGWHLHCGSTGIGRDRPATSASAAGVKQEVPLITEAQQLGLQSLPKGFALAGNLRLLQPVLLQVRQNA